MAELEEQTKLHSSFLSARELCSDLAVPEVRGKFYLSPDYLMIV